MKKLQFVIATFWLMFFYCNSQVVPNKDWITYYSSQDTIENVTSDMDANNTVYSTGYVYSSTTNIDLIVQARDSTGLLLWTTLYDNGGTDKGKSIKFTSSGVFVTGVSDGLGKDYVTLKLNATTGATVWATRMNNFGSFNDEPFDIDVDGSGNSYVTGSASASGGAHTDMVTVKYNNSGVQQWKNTYAGTVTASYDSGISMVVSGNGSSVFVTGTNNKTSSNSNIVTRSINSSNGTSNWTTIYNGTSNGNDKAYKIIRSGTSIVICGQSANTTTGIDYITIKYNGSTGSAIWSQTYDSGNYTNVGTDLVRDSTGNIATTGYVYNNSTYAYHTVKYDSLGNQTQVNIENTGLGSLTVDPHIVCDTIAHHFYVCGEAMRSTRDIFVYQIAPSLNTKWKQYVDGQNYDLDAATSIVVNGIGVVYLSALSKNTNARYDITTIKISQTPVYFPPDIVSNEKPMDSHLYYENRGQVILNSTTVASDILFSTMDFYYPSTFVSANRISYKLSSHSDVNNGTDSTQRIDINMFASNPLAVAYPYEPAQGVISYMQQGMPDAVTGIQGYRRYFIPNVYPNIDLHYFSNENGLKMYYVLKPMAEASAIQWEIAGANSVNIVGANLEIEGFNKKIIFDRPSVYTVNNSGQAIALTNTALPYWTNSGTIGIHVPPYNNAWPLIIELDYSNNITTGPTVTDNMPLCTYYGGSSDDGFTDLDVDLSTGDFVALGATRNVSNGVQFPTVFGTTVSISTNTNNSLSYFTVVLFDKDGIRKAANTYGGIPGGKMSPLKAIIHGSKITVVGNCSITGALPVYSSLLPLSTNCYSTNTNGEGFVMQFQLQSNYNISDINWTGRLNGFASDIDKTPDGSNIYITSSTNNTTPDTKTLTGAYNKSSLTVGMTGDYNFQISKFDSSGVRVWSTLFPVSNVGGIQYQNNLFGNNSAVLSFDGRLKCRIACDNYGFYLAGESNHQAGWGSYNGFSKYGVTGYPLSGFKDAFFARFGKKDSLVYVSFFGGATGSEAYHDIKVMGPNEVVAVGYSTSWDNWQSNLLVPNGTAYQDTTMVHVGYPNTSPAKMLITKFDSIGNRTWSTFYGNNAIGDCIGWNVKGDGSGRFFITGRDSGGFVMPTVNPTGVYNQSSNTDSESFMLAFDSGNHVVWNTHLGGARNEIGLALEYNSVSDRVILTGITNSRETILSPYFPIQKDASIPSASWHQPVLNQGNAFSYDGYISFFNKELVVGVSDYFKDDKINEAFNLFPNPAQLECQLAFKNGMAGKVKIEVYNQMGQLVALDEQNDIRAYSILTLKTSQLVNGVYIVKIENAGTTQSKKLIISK